MAANRKKVKHKTAIAQAKQYAMLAYAGNVIDKALKGGAANPEAVERALHAKIHEKGEELEKKGIEVVQVASLKEKKLDLFDILQTVIVDNGKKLTIPLRPDPRIMIVEVEGKVFEATISKDTGGDYKVTLSSCYLDKDNNLAKVLCTPEPVKVRINDAQEVVAIGPGMEIRQGYTLNLPHQADVLLATHGLRFDPEAGTFVNINGPRPHPTDVIFAIFGIKLDPDKRRVGPIKKIPKDHLITSGTATGKTGMLIAKTITSPQGGIIVVPDAGVRQAEGDALKFVGNNPDSKPLVIDSTNKTNDKTKLSPEDLTNIREALSREPPRIIIMGHGFLQDYAKKKELLEKEISLSIDEAHEIPTRLLTQLRGSKNHITAVTGTPTTALRAVFGKPTLDISVWYVQTVLHRIRPVTTSDTEVANEDPATLASAALTQHLGRSAQIEEGMEGYEPSRPQIKSSEVQGMVCTDDAETARAVFNLLNVDKSLGLTEKQTARLTEMESARRIAIENSMKIDIIIAIRKAYDKNSPATLRDELEKKLRCGGNIDEEYNQAVTEFKGNSELEGKVKANIRAIGNTAPLEAYANRVSEYLAARSAEDIKKEEEVVNAVVANYRQPAVLLLKSTHKDELQKQQAEAEALYRRGLIMQIITDGPLQTGFSSKNTLNVTYLQMKERTSGHTISVMQSMGRPIRDTDLTAFVNMVVRKSIPKAMRCMRADEVYSANATEIYMDHLTKEEAAAGLKQKETGTPTPQRKRPIFGRFIFKAEGGGTTTAIENIPQPTTTRPAPEEPVKKRPT